MSPRFKIRIETLATGNELLDGSTSDRHTQSLAAALRPLGLKIHRSSVVRDDRLALRKALVEAGLRSDVVVVTGGLGPTSDDLSLEVAAECFGSRLEHSKDAERNVRRRLKKLKREGLNAGHWKQMQIPKGSRVLENPEGTAPGIHWKIGDRQFFFLPGVPREFRSVLETHLVPFFQKLKTGEAEHLFVFKVFGWAESALNELMKKCPIGKDIEVGYRTHLPENHLKFLVRASSRALAERKMKPVRRFLKQKLGPAWFGEGSENFEGKIYAWALKNRLKLALAESCTGGLASSLLTRVPGSSQVFDRSFVTYSNQSKVDLLGVDPKSLEKHGAVSEEVARQMALGALQRSEADVALSITGVAGPSGGTRQKPVGTVWMAKAVRKELLGSKRKPPPSFSARVETRKFFFPYDRSMNQMFSAYSGWFWLLESEVGS